MVWGIGDVWRFWMILNWTLMIKGVTHAQLGPIWYHSESLDVPYSPNQLLGCDFFCCFLQQEGSKAIIRGLFWFCFFLENWKDHNFLFKICELFHTWLFCSSVNIVILFSLPTLSQNNRITKIHNVQNSLILIILMTIVVVSWFVLNLASDSVRLVGFVAHLQFYLPSLLS